MFFNPKRKIINLSIPLEERPLKSLSCRAIFTSLSINSYILFDLKVTFTPALDPLVLKLEIDFLNFVVIGLCPVISEISSIKILIFYHQSHLHKDPCLK